MQVEIHGSMTKDNHMKAKVRKNYSIDAFQWTGSNMEEAIEFLGSWAVLGNSGGRLQIVETAYSDMFIPRGDWIVRLQSGKFLNFSSEDFRELFSIDE